MRQIGEPDRLDDGLQFFTLLGTHTFATASLWVDCVSPYLGLTLDWTIWLVLASGVCVYVSVITKSQFGAQSLRGFTFAAGPLTLPKKNMLQLAHCSKAQVRHGARTQTCGPTVWWRNSTSLKLNPSSPRVMREIKACWCMLPQFWHYLLCNKS